MSTKPKLGTGESKAKRKATRTELEQGIGSEIERRIGPESGHFEPNRRQDVKDRTEDPNAIPEPNRSDEPEPNRTMDLGIIYSYRTVGRKPDRTKGRKPNRTGHVLLYDDSFEDLL